MLVLLWCASAFATDSPAPLDASAASAVANAVVGALGKARELPVEGPLAVEMMTPVELRAVVKASMYDYMTREQSDVLTRAQVALGIVPPGTDGEALILDVLEEGMLGLYDTRGKRLLVSSAADPALLPMVIGHESAHALQDTTFGLEPMRAPMPGRSDAETARTFLVEGDAQAAWTALAEGAGMTGMPLRAQSDAILADRSAGPISVMVRALQLPYAEGTATILDLVAREGWPAVDALYARLPDSTEQMLHVEKLIAREAPIPVRADAGRIAAAAPGWSLLWEDELGEAGVLVSAADVVSTDTARACAAGWGGDRFVTLDRPGADVPLAIGKTRWDSPEDAAEFEACWSLYLDARFPGRWAIERRGAEVVSISGASGPLAKKLGRTGWKALRAAY